MIFNPREMTLNEAMSHQCDYSLLDIVIYTYSAILCLFTFRLQQLIYSSLLFFNHLKNQKDTIKWRTDLWESQLTKSLRRYQCLDVGHCQYIWYVWPIYSDPLKANSKNIPVTRWVKGGIYNMRMILRFTHSEMINKVRQEYLSSSINTLAKVD